MYSYCPAPLNFAKERIGEIEQSKIGTNVQEHKLFGLFLTDVAQSVPVTWQNSKQVGEMHIHNTHEKRYCELRATQMPNEAKTIETIYWTQH